MAQNAQESLETEFVDKFGFFNVLQMLGEIATGKSEHLTANWQDGASAEQFDKVAEILDNASAKVKDLNIP